MDEKDLISGATQLGAELVSNTTFYEDTLQPVCKELGKTFGTLGKTINVVLSPFALSVWGFEKIKDYLVEQLEEKLKNVDESDIISPNPHVAGPLIEAMRFTGNNDKLREMFANLLANSMDKNTEENVHPAYVDIIKNITSDEARIMSYLGKKQRIASIDVRNRIEDNSFTVLVRNLINIDDDDDDELTPVNGNLHSSYFDNLCRLGLIEIPHGVQIANTELYDKITQNEHVEEQRS